LEHAKLAKTLQVKHALAPHNGEMILLSEKGAKIIDVVPSGRLHEDCKQIISADDFSLRERNKMAYAGHVSVSVVINNKGALIGGPDPRASGFPHGNNGRELESFWTLLRTKQSVHSLPRVWVSAR